MRKGARRRSVERNWPASPVPLRSIGFRELLFWLTRKKHREGMRTPSCSSRGNFGRSLRGLSRGASLIQES